MDASESVGGVAAAASRRAKRASGPLQTLTHAASQSHRARSTPDAPSPLLQAQTNPHPVPVASFVPQTPIPLRQSWSWYLDDTSLWGVRSVAECLERMGYLGTVDSVQSFWCFFNQFEKKLLTEKKLGTLSCQGSIEGDTTTTTPAGANAIAGNGRYNWRIFDALIPPVWEDESHNRGGKFILRCGGEGELRATKVIWTKLVLAMVGANFRHQEIICGCVLACRPHKKEIQVWIKQPPTKTKQKRARNGTNAPDDTHKDEAPVRSTEASPAASPAPTPAASPPPVPSSEAHADATSAPSASTTTPSSSSSCICHIDPLLCMTNDIRSFLGLPLSLPGSSGPPAVKIDYVSHEATMADVATRHKRLRQQGHSKRDGDRTPGGGDSSKSSSVKEKDRLVSSERAEREKRRAIEFEKDKRAEAADKKKTDKAAAAAAAHTPNQSPRPSPSPSPRPSPSPSPLQSPLPISSPPVGSPMPSASPPVDVELLRLSSSHQKYSWADATDVDGDVDLEEVQDGPDLGLDSSDYATSAASSVTSTPDHSARMQSRTINGSANSSAARRHAAMLRWSAESTMNGSSDATTLELLATPGSTPPTRRRPPIPLSKLRLESPAALALAVAHRGTKPLQHSGDRGYHPEPDSPGRNGTPMPSPIALPYRLPSPLVDGSAVPGPSPSHSPFSALHLGSPRSSGGPLLRADGRSGGPHMIASRGASRLSGTFTGGAFSPAEMLTASPSPSPDDARAPPLDLEKLALPPAGRRRRAAQETTDPPQSRSHSRVLSGASATLLAFERSPTSGPVPAAEEARRSRLAHLAAAATCGTEDAHPGEKETPTTLHIETTTAAEDTTEKESAPLPSPTAEPFSLTLAPVAEPPAAPQPRKKAASIPSSAPQPVVKKRAHKPRAAPSVEDPLVSRRARARAIKTYTIYACVALVVAVLVYALFFTTLAPEPTVFRERITATTKSTRPPITKLH